MYIILMLIITYLRKYTYIYIYIYITEFSLQIINENDYR